MKDKRFLKVIAIVITPAIVLILGLMRITNAQTYVTVSADHDLLVESEYEYFSMEYRSTAYFEIKFDIKAAKGTGTKDVEVILSADEDEGDYEVDDDDTFIYYLGDDAYSLNMTSYDEIGPDYYGDIDMPAFTALFLMAALEDDDWADYTWEGSEIEKITVSMVAGSTSLTDILKIKEYKFEDSPDGNDHDESQDFGAYDSLYDADWDTLGGAPVIDTSDDTLYLRSSYLGPGDFDGDGFIYTDCDDTDPNTYPGALEICDGKDNNCDRFIPANEVDRDGDGFMICEGDCDDSDDTVYPGASGAYKGKDNNCNGIIDKDEKKRPSYPTYTPIFPSWTQYQQLWRLSLLPMYMQQQKQNWYHYQSNLYQQVLIQTLYSGGEFCPFFAQPYWYQSYLYSCLSPGIGFGPKWIMSFPWQIPSRQTISGTTVVRYRSPVHIRLTLNNTSNEQVTGDINLDLYDLSKKKISNQKESLTIEPGQMDYTLSLKKVPENTGTKDYATYNLKYSFLGGGVTIKGQKSLFDVADKLEVRVVGPDSFHIDQKIPVRVHAFVHGRPEPVKDAAVTVDLLQEGKTKQLGRYKTNNDGFLEASLNFSNNVAGTGKLRIKVSSPFGSETIEEDMKKI